MRTDQNQRRPQKLEEVIDEDERMRRVWKLLKTVEEKHTFAKLCDSKKYFPSADMRQWWEDVGHWVDNIHIQLEYHLRFRRAIEQYGVWVYHHGTSAHGLRCKDEMKLSLGTSFWPDLSQEDFLIELDDGIELFNRTLAGEKYMDVWNEVQERKDERIRIKNTILTYDDVLDRIAESEPEPAPKPVPIIPQERPPEQLAERLRALPHVNSLHARIEKTPDGKTVLLFLNLSQHERATIALHGLDEIVYDDEPAYTKEQLDKIQGEYDEEIESLQESIGYADEDDPDYARELREHLGERQKEIAEEIRRFKAERRKYTLLDYLSYPFTKECDSRLEATQFADKLQKTINKIRDDIKKYEQVEDTRETRG